jgi:hypothetical protein
MLCVWMLLLAYNLFCIQLMIRTELMNLKMLGIHSSVWFLHRYDNILAASREKKKLWKIQLWELVYRILVFVTLREPLLLKLMLIYSNMSRSLRIVWFQKLSRNLFVYWFWPTIFLRRKFKDSRSNARATANRVKYRKAKGLFCATLQNLSKNSHDYCSEN